MLVTMLRVLVMRLRVLVLSTTLLRQVTMAKGLSTSIELLQVRMSMLVTMLRVLAMPTTMHRVMMKPQLMNPQRRQATIVHPQRQIPISPTVHRATMELHRATMELHRATMKLHRARMKLRQEGTIQLQRLKPQRRPQRLMKI
ncbi:hypothetical protein P43SY_011866 [Pythium insidiosum]|uniref:Uncharacterized protein n=1 Tax=Pythium insidiosum TaxID=114742 RepID=A0AAD5Q1H4_PYTIN|nr:hypothetical protein P43SY_011866 [Pythium insidiosum]